MSRRASDSALWAYQNLTDNGPDREAAQMFEIVNRVGERVGSLLEERPGLAVMSPEELMLVMLTRETRVSYASAVERAALGLLLVRAVERRDDADAFSGAD